MKFAITLSQYLEVDNRFAQTHTQLMALYGIAKMYNLPIRDYDSNVEEDYDQVEPLKIKKKHLHILNLIADISIALDKVPLMGRLEEEPKEMEHQACWYMFECNVILQHKILGIVFVECKRVGQSSYTKFKANCV